MKQNHVAQLVNMKPTALSRLLNDKRKIGPATAQKIAAFTGQPWQQYVHMPGHELKKVLQEAYLNKVAK